MPSLSLESSFVGFDRCAVSSPLSSGCPRWCPILVSVAKDWMRFEGGKRLWNAKKVLPLFLLLLVSVIVPPFKRRAWHRVFFPALASYLSRAHRTCSTSADALTSTIVFAVRANEVEKGRLQAECEARKEQSVERSRKSFFSLLLLNLLPLPSFSSSSSLSLFRPALPPQRPSRSRHPPMTMSE